MPRSLFALCLFLFAASAMADTPVTGEDSNVRPGKSPTNSGTPDGDAIVGGRSAATPARSAAPNAVTPRWHRLLPGMIR